MKTWLTCRLKEKLCFPSFKGQQTNAGGFLKIFFILKGNKASY
jgi:hypothetical protein